MTREEAIDVLKANYPDSCYELLREAVDMAIEALRQKEKLWDTKFNAAPWVEAANYLLERLADVPAKEIVTAKDRVEEERIQLAERLDKLSAFLGSEERSMISRKQYDLLLMQRNVMERYLMILNSRLVSWGGGKKNEKKSQGTSIN